MASLQTFSLHSFKISEKSTILGFNVRLSTYLYTPVARYFCIAGTEISSPYSSLIRLTVSCITRFIPSSGNVSPVPVTAPLLIGKISRVPNPGSNTRTDDFMYFIASLYHEPFLSVHTEKSVPFGWLITNTFLGLRLKLKFTMLFPT